MVHLTAQIQEIPIPVHIHVTQDIFKPMLIEILYVLIVLALQVPLNGYTLELTPTFQRVKLVFHVHIIQE